MALTNFPQGASSLGVPILGQGIPVAANYWWVDSQTGSSGYTGAYDAPYALLSQAISAGAAGDCIILKAGHAETISAAGGVTLSKAGMTVIGLGSGAKRPTFTFSATASTFIISAASVSVSNIIGTPSIDSVVSAFSISAGSVTLGTPAGPVEWQDGTSAIEAVRAVLGTTAADNLTINLNYIGFTAGDACVNAIRLVGTNDAVINCNFYGKASTGWVEFLTTACTDISVYGYMYNSGTTTGTKNVVDTQGSGTWFANIFDGAAGGQQIGGSAAALGASSTAFSERAAVSSTAILANGTAIFTIAGGPIQITSLISECVVGGDSAASTVQYSITATGLSAQTISNASGSVANAAAHATVSLIGTALATAAVYNSKGVNLGMSPPGGIVSPVGSMTTVIGTADTTTGTWRHIIRYRPLVAGAYVVGV